MDEATDPILQPKSSFLNSKSLYLFSALIILLVVLGLVTYFFLKNSKPKTKPKSEPKKVATQSAQNKTNLGYVTSLEGLNLRKTASTDGSILLILPNKTEVKIINSQNDWYFIEANTKGFVAKEFISQEKPTDGVLKTFSESPSPFTFLYPELYTVSMNNTDNVFEYSFTGNDSYGGFKVEKDTEAMFTIGNYALTKYPGAKKEACDIKFGYARKECEKLTTETGTVYLVLFNNSLYKFTYLKTEGGLLTDMNNLVFSSLVPN